MSVKQLISIRARRSSVFPYVKRFYLKKGTGVKEVIRPLLLCAGFYLIESRIIC